MKKLAFVLSAAFLFTNIAFAEESCDAQAAAKKLNGAAKTSFLKKCERDAKAKAASNDCAAKAAEKKLKGAAKNSFIKKCEKDAAQ